jgi:hypothetical protein
MFGSKESKIEKMVQKGKWDKLNKMLRKDDVETRLLIAKQCEKSESPNVNSILALLIRDDNQKVQLAAIKSISVTGKDHEAAQLQWLLSNTPEKETEVIKALHEALPKITGRR